MNTTNCHSMSTVRSQTRCELADVFRRYLELYQQSYFVPLDQERVIQDIRRCRTAELGGHADFCCKCGFRRYAYNSCRNRHCPKCQALKKAKWVEQRKSELLPVPYFHNVFTLPHELNLLILCNKRTLLKTLFHAVSRTLTQFGKNNLGGKIGFIMILHTWDQTLRDHFHLHCVIPAGAFSLKDQKWIHANPKFLFSVRALSKVFRAKFIAELKQNFVQGDLNFPGSAGPIGTAKGFARLLAQLKAKDWVVYSKRPFSGPNQVLDYVARYTHRVAISNDRIVGLQGDQVTFRYRDRKKGTTTTMRLKPVEFIRRFLLHVLPSGFMRIRHYGLLANRCKTDNLKLCREALGEDVQQPQPTKRNTAEWIKLLLGIEVDRCPRCQHAPLLRVLLHPVISVPVLSQQFNSS